MTKILKIALIVLGAIFGCQAIPGAIFRGEAAAVGSLAIASALYFVAAALVDVGANLRKD